MSEIETLGQYIQEIQKCVLFVVQTKDAQKVDSIRAKLRQGRELIHKCEALFARVGQPITNIQKIQVSKLRAAYDRSKADCVKLMSVYHMDLYGRDSVSVESEETKSTLIFGEEKEEKTQEQKSKEEEMKLDLIPVNELDDFVEKIEKRDQQIKEIERDVLEVRELFLDVHSLVVGQQPMLDQATENIEHTKHNVVRAHHDLVRAEEHQRNTTCVML